MLIIDAAPRTEAEPFRSEHYLEWTQEKRNEIWTELIGRLAMAMHSLQEADKVGEGDLCVSHRMSSFWVLGRAIARQEGYEDRLLNAMQQMTLRQQGASVEGSELIDLIKMLPKSYAGKFLTASGWAKLLSVVVPERNRELLAKVSRKNWVAWQFTSEFHTLSRECGMNVGYDSHRKQNIYSFDKLEGRESEVMAAVAG